MSRKTKIWLVIATSLVLAGGIIFGGVMTVLKWDFTRLSTVKYETNEYEINEDYKNISIVTNTADILFVNSESTKTIVVCSEQKNVKHSVAVKDDTLIIEVNNTREWHEYIGINFGTPKITVYIPQKEYGVISVKASTGNIRVENVSAGTMDLSVSTGDVAVSELICEGDVKINVSTGKANIIDTRCKNVVSRGSTGDTSLKNVIATEKFFIERTTGDVMMEESDASEILVETNTGNVTGSLLSDKVFFAQTDTGNIDVPDTVTGGNCEITTTTGNIKIEIK